VNISESTGIAIASATEMLLNRRISGEELAHITFLFESVPGTVHDRATIAIRAYAMRDPIDQNCFFNNEHILHQVVTNLEEQLTV
jgi:hypothetical protein